MSEDFLHYLWKYRLFKPEGLATTRGEPVMVIFPGVHNVHAGPDFHHARIRIGDAMWAGQVEIHLKASDWNRHRHQGDERYHNVILHVVFDDDSQVFMQQPGDLPVLHIRPLIDPSQWETYCEWRESAQDIPCANRLGEIETLTWLHWKDRLLAERLEEKASHFLHLLDEVRGDWDTAFYRTLARVMGKRVNAGPFDQLAMSVPWTLISRHRDNPETVEAILFGTAGLLPEQTQEDYPSALIRSFDFYRQKYGLEPLRPGVWNTGRIRPANHPCLRIAQFAGMVSTGERLVAELLELADPAVMRTRFSPSVNAYWKTHYQFIDTGSSREMRLGRTGRPGQETVTQILINAVAVLFAAWGKFHSDDLILDKALKMLEFCEAEQNGVMRKWRERGVNAAHAADSQALIQLSNNYCSHRRCLDCMIGSTLIQRSNAASDSELL